LFDEITVPGNGQIKCFINLSGNPVMSTPNGSELIDAFKQLDFFIGIDFSINETNHHADIILPPVSPMERDHYDLVFNLFSVRNRGKYVKAPIRPERGTQQDWQILAKLHDMLAKNDSYLDKLKNVIYKNMTPRGLLRLACLKSPHKGLFRQLTERKSGIDFGPLRPQFKEKIAKKFLKHRSGFINLIPDLFAKELQKLFLENIEILENQYSLVGRRILDSNNSWVKPKNYDKNNRKDFYLHMNDSDALVAGIDFGEKVRVKGGTNEIVTIVKCDDEICPGVVSLPHGMASFENNADVNCLTSRNRLDSISYNAAFSGTVVTVEKYIES
ncbi:molybdopterin-dependent oxidoreductase, partial [Bacteriovoracaceae bacterium]|nr:molybdopterin-dependent oxidoreductase [Bacteriovoracaceae bacterium]